MKDNSGRPGGLPVLRTEPCGLGHSAGIPDAWQFLADGEISLPDNSLVFALGRYGDVYGPVPAEMFHPDAWNGNMLHGSHDLIAVALCQSPWRDVIANDAQAIEARRAATGTGAVHESAVRQDAPKSSGPNKGVQ